MKLFYSPFACSLAAHIACREAGLDVELVRVDLATKRIATGGDLFEENPMGQVPTLVLPEGRTLTENVAVLSYIADRTTPQANDSYERTRWLSFVATEIHKKILWPIFSKTTPDAVKDYARASAPAALDVVSAHLSSRDVLIDHSFTVADAYLFWAVNLLPHAGLSWERFPVLRRYHAAHRTRPAVRAALAYEQQQFAAPLA